MKTKYSGQCPICNIAWAVGDEIFFEKEPKSICKSADCFNAQKAIGGLDKMKASKTLAGDVGKPQPQTQVKTRTIEDKTKDAKEMLTLLFPMALNEARNNDEIKKLLADERTQFEGTKQTLILAECIYKGLVEEWIR